MSCVVLPAGLAPTVRRRSRRPALAATAACLLTGWLPLTVLGRLHDDPARPASGHDVVRSPWTYWGGTVGDLVLPVIVYGLVRGLGRLRAAHPPAAVVGRAAAAGAVTAAALGALGQSAWLADPDPQRNWLVVAPHTFSAPGWYHAAYLVVMASCVGGLVTAWLVRLRQALRGPDREAADRARAMLARPGSVVVMSAVGLFALTVVVDSLPTAGTSSSRATIAVVCLPPTAVLGVLVAVLGRHARHLARPLLVAALVTGAVAVPVCLLPPGSGPAGLVRPAPAAPHT